MSKSSSPSPVAPRRKPPVLLITMAIAAVFVVVAIVISLGGDGVRWVNGQAVIEVATVDECQEVTYYFVPGVDTHQATETLFEAIRRVEGVGTATAFENPPSIVVDYCQSQITEPQIWAVLGPTGVIQPAAFGAPTTPAAPQPAPTTPPTTSVPAPSGLPTPTTP